MKKLIVVIGSLFLASALFLAALPSFLSSSLGKNLLVSIVNSRIDGTLLIDSLDLNWLTGQSIKGIRLNEPSGETLISIEEIDAGSPLWRIWFSSLQMKPFHLRQLNAEIGQDAMGVTNLEALFNVKKSQSGQFQAAKVTLNQVNADLVLNDSGLFTLKAAGLTRQNDLKGQFNLDGTFGKEMALKVRAQNFPLLFIDQTAAIKNPALAGLIIETLGDAIDLSLDTQHNDSLDRFTMIAKSPYTSWNLVGTLQKDQLVVDPTSKIQFSIPTAKISHRLSGLQLQQNHLSGNLIINQLNVPLKDWTRLSVDLPIALDSLQIQPDGKDKILLSEVKALLKSKEDSKLLRLSFNAKGEMKQRPLFAEIEGDIPQTALKGGMEEILDRGVTTRGRFHGPVQIDWEGLIKEVNTELKFNIHSDDFSLSNFIVHVDRLPLKAGKPLIATFENREFSQKEGRLNGRLHVDSVGMAEFDLKVQLEQFNPKLLQTILPNHPVELYVGNSIDAKLFVHRLPNGDLSSTIDLTTPKNGDSFLRKLNGKFTLESDLDLAFDLSIQQKVGSVTLVGTLNELFDSKGKWQFDEAEATVKGTLRHFPVALATQIALGDKVLADKMEAILGSQVDGDIDAFIHNGEGPIRLDVKGLNGNGSLSGQIKKRIFTLNEPLTASLKITPQLEKVVLREWIPFLGSVVSSDQPIELLIAKEGFSFPIDQPSLSTLQMASASLKLNKMQFSKEGQLGKVANLLGVTSQTFEVWFTPVYFSFENGQVNVFRTDFLVANSYPLASWGAVNFNQESLRFIIAMTPAALQKAFKVKASNSYLLQIPLRGTISKPELDTAKVMTRISALIAQSKGGPQGLVIGTVLDAASGSFTEDKPPSPTTNPLPWTITASANEENKSLPETIVEEPIKMIEQPVKELQKGAKKLLKGLLG